VHDREGSGAIELRSRLVLNASGPWAEALVAGAGIAAKPTPRLRAVNLVLRKALVSAQALGGRGDGRYVFLVPWRGRSIVGTGYEAAEQASDDGGIGAFLAEARRAFPWAGLERLEVVLAHRGLVPGRGGAAGLLTRGRLVDHESADGLPGLISIQSVKYTTARASAEAAVDLVLRRLSRPAPPSRTAITPLGHARPLAGPLAEQARAAAREEMALHLTDAVLRRLDLGTAGPPAPEDVHIVSEAMASELGWDAARVEREKAALGAAYAPDGSVRDGESEARV
jgi:glycerol-3-phosphate dehydrogenase